MNHPPARLFIECNCFALFAIKADFQKRVLMGGPDMIAKARSAAPHMFGERPGFVAATDLIDPWQSLPRADRRRAERSGGVNLPGKQQAMSEPNSPVGQAFFNRLMQQWKADLHEQVIKVDAPGLTSPILSCFRWQHMQNPVLPIDDHAEWELPA